MTAAIPVIAGEKFGRWTVIGLALQTARKRRMFQVICECGTVRAVGATTLKNRVSRSCGCLHRELHAELMRKIKPTHGMHQTSEYGIWGNMKYRCENPNAQGYENYGGRGITVCKEWSESFEAFFRDMGLKPDGMSIDRIDNNLGYSKENCRWATKKEQGENRRTTAMVNYKGQQIKRVDFCRHTGIHQSVVSYYTKKGLSGDEIAAKRPGKSNRSEK